MTSSEQRLTAILLSMAAERYSNFGCNDFDLSEVIPDLDERNALVLAAHEWNGDPEEYDEAGEGPDYRLPDWYLMDYMAHRLAP